MNLKKADKLYAEWKVLQEEAESLVAALKADEAAGIYIEFNDPRYLRLTALMQEPNGLIIKCQRKAKHMLNSARYN